MTATAQSAISQVNKSVQIVAFDSKGLGLQALQDIPSGSLLASEQPLLTGPKSLTALQTEYEKLELVLADQLSTRSAEDQQRFLAFTNAHEGDKSVPLLCGIYRTNAIPMSDQNTGGVFTTISRINHSCVPNCAYSWNSRIQREGRYWIAPITWLLLS